MKTVFIVKGGRKSASEVFAKNLSKHIDNSSVLCVEKKGFFDVLKSVEENDLVHFISKPSFFSSILIKTLLAKHRKKCVQTILFSNANDFVLKNSVFADKIIVASKYMKKRLESVGVVSKFIPIGVETDRPIMDSARAKNLFGIKEKRMILFASNLMDYEGMDNLWHMLSNIRYKYPSTTVTLACNDLHKSKKRFDGVIHRIYQRKFKFVVKSFEFVENMWELICAADIVVLPVKNINSKIDHPLILLEAMAAGKPIVFSNIPPMNELYENDSNIMLKNGYDFNEFTDAVMALVDNPTKTKAMSTKANAFVKKRFNIKNTAKEYVKFYES